MTNNHTRPHRFPEVSCSQCGSGFGSGNHGYSDCLSHLLEFKGVEAARKSLRGRGDTEDEIDERLSHYRVEIAAAESK